MSNGVESTVSRLEELAIKAYDAYGTDAGWKTFDGRPMPKWYDLGDAVQAHWREAVYAACASVDPEFLNAHSEPKKVDWRYAFDDRSMTEIKFAQEYLDKFNHGTTGHNALVIIAKLAKLLDANGAQALPYA